MTNPNMAPIARDGKLRSVSRRAMLGGTAAACLATGATAVPAMQANSDAALLAAFDDYANAYRRIDNIRDDKDPEQEAAYQAMYAAQDMIADAVPQGALGLAAFLKVAFQNISQSMPADDAVFYGKEMPDGEHSYLGSRMIWNLIQHLEGDGRVSLAS